MPVARLAAARFARADGSLAVDALTWAVAAGEGWAVTGPGGAGKTGLAESLAGRHRLTAGAAVLPPAGAVRLVGFRERSRRFDHLAHHHAERFNPTDPLLAVTVADYLGADPGDLLGVRRLLGRPLLALSNGEHRRVRLVRALLASPALLVLDDPYLGVDAAGREELDAVLAGRVRGGPPVVLTCRPAEVPGWVTHVLELDALTARWRGPRAEWRPARSPEVATLAAAPPGEPLVELHDVTVRHAGRVILDRVTWTVRRGERWHLLGPNGAGKSTLLSLVAGDHPQRFSNDVRLFGRRPGDGGSVWDLKRRIGVVSPELHLSFNEPLTARRAALTGFTNTLVPGPVTPEQAATVDGVFAAFGLADVADVPFARLPTGAQRLVLVARAVVKSPDLLVLDEPFQGLEAAAVQRVRAWLAAELRPEQALVIVTHRPDELPAGLTHALRLDAGRVVT